MQISSKTSAYFRSIFLRRIGGAPRTFPGGLNKWQWKRMHEKNSWEKEKRLLEQEKQAYEARVLSQIRAQVAHSDSWVSGPESAEGDGVPQNYGPLTPEEHIKVLADRFMKEGAEDLCSERDGPVETPLNKPEKSRVIGQHIDLQKLITKGSFSDDDDGTSGYGEVSRFSKAGSSTAYSTYCELGSRFHGNFENFRSASGFGMWRSHQDRILLRLPVVLKVPHYSSMAAQSTEKGSNTRARSRGGRSVAWPKFHVREMDSSNDDDTDDYDDDVQCKVFGNRASLGKYDTKIYKRVPLKFLEADDDLSQHVDSIRMEVMRRREMKEDDAQSFEEQSLLSTKRFDECNISLLTVHALTEAGYVQMNRVQEETLSAFLDGKDAMVKTGVGKGKSIAFLLPAIETVLRASESSIGVGKRVSPIYVLILCPTRELASQVSAEANVLLKHHNGIGLQTLTGRTRFKVDQRRLESEPCHILIATPCILLDHIENKSSISLQLMQLQMLIVDEADHLLDLGFRRDIEKILDCLPRQRQSLLFSARIPREVRRLSQLVLKKDHTCIDKVGHGHLESIAMVKHSYLVVPHTELFETVYYMLKKHISEVIDYKVVIFCATAMMASLFHSLFHGMRLNVREIHSNKPPLVRARISDEFKDSKQLILMTSAVSTGETSYPDVTLVIQVGIPSDRGQYIRRLRKTGHQGKETEGILLLSPWEDYFLNDLKDLHLEKLPSPDPDPHRKAKIEESMNKVDKSLKEAAYHAWLGYYNSIYTISRDKTLLVESANEFAKSIGLEKPPGLYRKTALKVGLKDTPGIRVRR